MILKVELLKIGLDSFFSYSGTIGTFECETFLCKTKDTMNFRIFQNLLLELLFLNKNK